MPKNVLFSIGISNLDNNNKVSKEQSKTRILNKGNNLNCSL